MIFHWIQLGLGVLSLLFPWLLGYHDLTMAKWGSIVLGLALIIINTWQLFGEESH